MRTEMLSEVTQRPRPIWSRRMYDLHLLVELPAEVVAQAIVTSQSKGGDMSGSRGEPPRWR